MFLDEFFTQDEVASSLAGGGAGAAGAKLLGQKALSGAIPGALLGLSVPEIKKYAEQGKYGQAAIAAAGGLAGLVPNPVIGVGGGLAAAAVNKCLDDPESCKDFFTGKSEGGKIFNKRMNKPAQGQGLDPASSGQGFKAPKNLQQEDTEKFRASPNLIQSIKDIESGNNPAAVSPKGALGTMQVMPPTATNPGFGITPAKDFSSGELERVGQDYFNAMLNKYGGDKRLALIAYNMGPTATDKWLSKGSDPTRLPRETQGYVPKVLNKYQQTNTVAGAAPAAPSYQPVAAKPVKPVADRTAQQRPMYTGADSSRVPYAYTTPTGQRTNRISNIDPGWTPPPGPKITPKPNPQELEKLIRQKDRPASIDDIINKAKRKELSQVELKNLINQLTNSTDPVNPEILSFLNNLSSDTPVAEHVVKKMPIVENNNKLADKIYDILEIRYGDLVRLYGHEVVGDAIQEVVLQSQDELDPDLNSLAKSVLTILRSRLEEQLKETDDAANDSPDQDTEHHNAVIQIQADLDKIKNTLNIKESKIYFNVVATSKEDLKNKFGLQKDKKGWYLSENASSQMKLDALRTFTMK